MNIGEATAVQDLIGFLLEIEGAPRVGSVQDDERIRDVVATLTERAYDRLGAGPTPRQVGQAMAGLDPRPWGPEYSEAE